MVLTDAFFVMAEVTHIHIDCSVPEYASSSEVGQRHVMCEVFVVLASLGAFQGNLNVSLIGECAESSRASLNYAAGFELAFWNNTGAALLHSGVQSVNLDLRKSEDGVMNIT